MRRILKSKKGFTLIEMVLVIAIIVILAAVLVFGLGTYVNRAKNAASSVRTHNESISAGVSAVDAQMDL